MTRICWLGPSDGPESMPPPSLALDEPNGLLAAGGALRPEWLLQTYERGIFPWYERGQPILWWSPNPRAVLWPNDIKVSRSLRRTMKSGRFRVSADRAFGDVIAACAAPRDYTDSTWITADMEAAYNELHTAGWAHSFESWDGDELAGGLYGVAIGRVFFGESMFARRTDASKVAFAHAVAFMRLNGFKLIDCQVASAHLSRFGAITIPRETFLQHLGRYCRPHGTAELWSEKFELYQATA